MLELLVVLRITSILVGASTGLMLWWKNSNALVNPGRTFWNEFFANPLIGVAMVFGLAFLFPLVTGTFADFFLEDVSKQVLVMGEGNETEI